MNRCYYHQTITPIRVIRILDEYRVIVDYGSRYGAKAGQKLIIVQNHEIIYDLDTNEKLGELSIGKANLVIKKSYPQFSVCINGESKDLFSAPRRLNVDVKQISIEPPSMIIIGDIVEIDNESNYSCDQRL